MRPRQRILSLAAATSTALALLAASALADERLTERISTGPLGGNTAQDTCEGYPPSYGCTRGGRVLLSEDGTKAVFTSPEQLTADDADGLVDIYERSGGDTRLVSAGPLDNTTPSLQGTSADASAIFFTTAAQLAPEDTDSQPDVYARVNGTATVLVSTGPLDAGNAAAGFGGNTPDGTRVFFQTVAQLTPDDTDTSNDLYERSSGTTRLVSTTSCPGGCLGGRALGISDDGTRVAFSVTYPNTSRSDLFVATLAAGQWTTELVSRPPSLSTNSSPSFKYLSQDGSRVYFVTTDPLAPGAAPSSSELYVHSASGFELVSTGSVNECTFNCGVGFFVGVSADETHVFFSTGKRLEPTDTDTNGNQDLYERVGNTTTLLTPGMPICPTPNFCPPAYKASSADGARVIFSTNERLAAGDTDGDYDLYERFAGTTTLLTPTGAPAGTSSFINGEEFVRASPDARRVIFTTAAKLTADDTDPVDGCLYDDGDGETFNVNCMDVYATEGGMVTLLSKGVSGSSAPREVYSFDLWASKDVQRVAFITREALTSDDTDGDYDDIFLSEPVVTGGYPRPRGASPSYFSLVPAYQPCAAPNRTHGAPLAFGSCAPPVRPSTQATVGAPEANGAAANMVGAANVKALAADVSFGVSITDVRNSAGLTDYAGALQARVGVRLTDRDGGVPSTTGDFPFSFPLPCATTTSTAVGSTCSVATTANSVLPGSVQASVRTLWALNRFEVYDDGGSLFATQGLFAP